MSKLNFKYYHSEKLIILIIVLCIIYGTISTWIGNFISGFSEPWKSILTFTDSFTVPFFMTLTFFIINKNLWQKNKIKWLIDVPNLNGRYEGTLESSFIENGQKKIMDCAIEIKQTASSIHIFSYFGYLESNMPSSSSISLSETIVKGNDGFFTLYFIFSNETGGLTGKLNNHTGTAKFLYYPDLKALDGSYYNKIKNTGIIKVTFVQEMLLGRLIK